MDKPVSFKRGFKSDSEKKALLYRDQLNIKSTDPLPAMLLADFLNIRVAIPAEVPGLNQQMVSTLNKCNKWSALTMDCLSGIRLIIHNPSHSRARQESNIMHEIAHILCNHSTPDDHFNVEIPLRSYNSQQEKEAEWLGGCLQLPREALLWALKNNMKESEISDYYNASQVMVKFRINKTGIVHQLNSYKNFRFQ